MSRSACVVAAVIACGLVSVVSAGPATAPATATTRYASKAAGLAFGVPKAWARQRTSAPDDQVFAFDLTPPAVAKKTPVRSKVLLTLGEPCERQKTLANVVADMRDGITRQLPGVTFTEDNAVQVAGRDAWTLLYTATSTGTRVEMRNGQRKETPVQFKEQRRTTLWLQNDTICQIALTAEPADAKKVETAAAAVVDTFEWEK